MEGVLKLVNAIVEPMASSEGFWSYVHSDDDAEGHRIVELARDIAAQFEMITDEPIRLFLDKNDLEWGVDWDKKIHTSIANVAFFIPVLTPRYFSSASCRTELSSFARVADKLGVKQLLLPLLYVDVPALHVEEPTDPLVELVGTYQWIDWTELRFASRKSPRYRRAVADLARRLADANAEADRTELFTDSDSDADEGDDSDGLMEKLAGLESALPELTETLDSAGHEISGIGELFGASTEKINTPAVNSSFAKRLGVVRALAADLAGPAQRIRSLGEDYTRQLHDVDLGVRAVIGNAPADVAANPENRAEYCAFFASLRGMVQASEEGLSSLDGMLTALTGMEGTSRDLRPPIRELRRGLTLMSEGRSVISAWTSLIDGSGVECDRDDPPGSSVTPSPSPSRVT